MPDEGEKNVKPPVSTETVSKGKGFHIKDDADFWEACIFAAAAMFIVIWRLAVIPPNPGGIFAQICVSCFGLLFFTFWSAWPLKKSLRLIGTFTTLPIWIAVIFGYNYFNITIFFPILFTSAAIGGIIVLWSAQKKIAAVFLLFILPFLISLWPGAFKHMNYILTVKGLEPQHVKGIVFVPSSKEKEKEIASVTVTKPEDIARLLAALRETYPYSPNHESLKAPWYWVGIILATGEEIVFRLGRGNKTSISAAWLGFGARGLSVYQNHRLFKTIEALGLPLQLKVSNRPMHGDKAFYFIIIFMGLVLFGIGIGIIVRQVRLTVKRFKPARGKG